MIKLNYKKYIFLLVILLSIIFTWSGILGSGDYWGMGNSMAHTYKLSFLSNSLYQEGNIPSWSSDWYGGYPFLGLYPPLSYYIFSPLPLVTNPLLALQISFFIITLMSTFAFYYLAKILFKKKHLAFFAALIFVFFPYNSISTKFLGLFAQYSAYLFIPFILIFYEKIKKKNYCFYFALIGLLVAFTTLTHHAAGLAITLTLFSFILSDYILTRNKKMFKLIPFILIGLFAASIFLLPSYQLKDTLNYDIIKQNKLILLGFKDFFNSKSQAYIGAIGFFALLCGSLTFLRKREHTFKRYYLTVLILFLLGFIGLQFTPPSLKSTLEWSHRLFIVLAPLLSIVFVKGLFEMSQLLIRLIKPWHQRIKKNISKIVYISLLIILIFNFILAMPHEPHSAPEKLKDFYAQQKEVQEYYRIEDRAFYGRGLSPIYHKKGIFNGGFIQAAPNTYFWLRDKPTKILLETDTGKGNFVSWYGALSIKYFIVNKQNLIYYHSFNCPNKSCIDKLMQNSDYIMHSPSLVLPYLILENKTPQAFDIIQSTNDYLIYENKEWLPYARLINNTKIVGGEDQNYEEILKFLSNEPFNFKTKALIITQASKNQFPPQNISNGRVTILERKGGNIKIKIENLQDKAYLVIAESYHPNWQANLNKQEVKIYHGVPSSLVIPVTNGLLNLQYNRPKITKAAFVITLLSFFVLIFFIITHKKRNS